MLKRQLSTSVVPVLLSHSNNLQSTRFLMFGRLEGLDITILSQWSENNILDAFINSFCQYDNIIWRKKTIVSTCRTHIRMGRGFIQGGGLFQLQWIGKNQSILASFHPLTSLHSLALSRQAPINNSISLPSSVKVE